MRRLLRSTSFWLAAASFFVYQINLRSISSADTFPTRYIPIGLLTGQGFHLDQFEFLREAEAYPLPGVPDTGLPYYLQSSRGHLVSTYPVMPAVLAVPVYALPVALGLTGDPTDASAGYTRTEIMGTLLSKIAASLSVAASVPLVFLIMLRLTGRRAALWIALLYAFATSTWSVSSQGAWQTSYSGPLLAATALCFLIARDTERGRRFLALAGLCVAVAVACRPTTGILAVALTVYVLLRHRRDIWAFMAAPAVIGALLVGYNLYYFGNLLGGYAGPYVAPYEFTVRQALFGTYGLLLSANRGLLTMSPVLIIPFVLMLRSLVRRDDALLTTLAVGIVLNILFYSTFTAWHGSFSFSYRYLVDMVPLLALYTAPAVEWLGRSRARLATVGALAVYSVGVQIVGTFYYPCDWYRSPLRDPQAWDRIFSWRDQEIVACLRAGPVYPDGLRLIRPPAASQTERPDVR